MRGLVFMGPGSIVVRDDLPDPLVEEPTDIVVRVTASGLCGSDLHPYRGTEPAGIGVVPGHEAVGEVVAVGDEVRRHAVGDRVLVPFTTSCGGCVSCRTGLSSRCTRGQLFGWGPPEGSDGEVLHGAQAELLRVPLADGTAVAVPEGVDDIAAVLLCDNLPTAWYAATRAGVRSGSEVAVVGLGSFGLCAVVAARALGASRVIGIDPVTHRAELARRLGAEAIDGDDVEPASVDAAIDAAGPARAQALAAELVRPGGTLSVIAVQTDEALGIDPVVAYDRNLTVRFGRAPVRSVLEVLLPRVAAGLPLPTPEVVTEHGVPLVDGPDAYRRFADRAPGVGKIVFDPRAT